ncbi:MULTISPECIES: NfeD family protein [Ramlibacter]|uniref:Nodulation protein NfeD n=1 Tax=Ramlibacter pinisoli TaxID=2682844 RepID=A0A6N8INC4_9BURK|nr:MULTISPECIES: nodulation protein NfeD [Ramlibacter]MBA2963095.1 nodulation protein NfeD [Ramlibacter sp. CGMCC 1.13660]MVQ28065.1 nodulation protein NfeD [Ramlibacter pinisoli]
MARALCRLLCVLALFTCSPAAWPQDAARAPVLVMEIDGAISPASADDLRRGLALAQRHAAQLLVLQLDTPGGLDTSMRGMIRDILSSAIPVATFVAPGGARAASAGTFILYASHVAAMTPASNLGAATPVAVGMPGSPPATAPHPPASGASAPRAAETDPLGTKRVSDAAAYIRSLAQLRGRNAEWGEKAVREAVSLSSAEALQLKVVDLVATDVPDLLRQLDGRELRLAAGTQQLHTRDAPVVRFEQDWRSRLLATIANPSLALLLLTVGLYALVFEFSSPGLIAPGVIGAICVLVALFALQLLPVNYAGLALIVLGIGFLVAEAFVPSVGVLGVGGVIAFALGAAVLIDSDSPGWGVPLWLIAVLSLASAAFVLGVVGMAARARRRPVVTGLATLANATGELVEFAGGEGWALVRGEHWRVHGPEWLQAGDAVRVLSMRDGVLEVAAD